MQRAENRKYHYIYKITRFDGKYYIGMHSTDDLDDGYIGSGKRLWYSIKKHGREKHNMQIIEFFSTRAELKLREKELVNEELLGDPACLNIQLGGMGGRTSGSFGSVDKSVHAAASLKGNHSPKRDYAALNAKANATKTDRGTHYKPLRGSWTRCGATAAAQSSSAREKRKQTFAKIAHQQGEKNSAFGTVWVNDGGKPVRIDKILLDEYLLKGYSRGRKPMPL